VAYVGGKLGDEIEVIELPWGAFVSFGLMVREDGEVAVAEMLHGLVHSQQFAIVSAVFLLC
jgi:hypothetical protein